MVDLHGMRNSVESIENSRVNVRVRARVNVRVRVRARARACVPRAEDGAFAGPNCPLFGGAAAAAAANLFTGADLICNINVDLVY